MKKIDLPKQRAKRKKNKLTVMYRKGRVKLRNLQIFTTTELLEDK